MSVYDTTVSRTILVVPDLDPARLSEEARAGLPRLPALEQWLARGDVQAVAGGWRQWVQRTFAGRTLAGLPPASIAGAAVAGVPADRPVWLATPVHFVPGLDTVRVHPAGLLPLAAAEQQALQRDFARDFAGAGWSLHATGRRELLLVRGSGEERGEVRSDDPATWLGADPREGLPRGPGAGPLRRLGAELEMWLHQHSINDTRAARGQLGVNALWLWGGGAAVARPEDAAPGAESGPRGAVWADELFVDGLARCTRWPLLPLPAAWPSQARASQAPEVRLVVAALGTPRDGHPLEAIDRDWIAPALAEWPRGTHELTLLTARSAVTLRGRMLRRAWRALRRSRPWWQGLAAC